MANTTSVRIGRVSQKGAPPIQPYSPADDKGRAVSRETTRPLFVLLVLDLRCKYCHDAIQVFHGGEFDTDLSLSGA